MDADSKVGERRARRALTGKGSTRSEAAVSS